MNVREAYQTLELDYGASLDEIEAAYKRLIVVWHPDRFINSLDLFAHSQEKAKKLNEAYGVLQASWSDAGFAEQDIDAESFGDQWSGWKASSAPSTGLALHKLKYSRRRRRNSVFVFLVVLFFVAGLFGWIATQPKTFNQWLRVGYKPVISERARRSAPESAANGQQTDEPGTPAISEKPSPATKADATEDRAPGARIVTNSIGMKLVEIPAGEFHMGSASSSHDASPQHQVRITKSFLLGQSEVTQSQWKRVMGTFPFIDDRSEKRQIERQGERKANELIRSVLGETSDEPELRDEPVIKYGANYPATWIDWHGAVKFCEKLSEMEGEKYRLPTEAEWEYSCRAGTLTRFSFGEDMRDIPDYAWLGDPDEKYAHEVCMKQPNSWGLCDMHGNVWEWCADCYDPKYYWASPTDDPQGPLDGVLKVKRGGHFGKWFPPPGSATRGNGLTEKSDSTGFRVVREK